MAQDTSTLREKLDKLSPNQKAELARTLIDSLDEDLDEAARRYEAYRRGGVFPPGGGGLCTSLRATQAMNLHFLSAEFGQAPLWVGGRQARGVSA